MSLPLAYVRSQRRNFFKVGESTAGPAAAAGRAEPTQTERNFCQRRKECNKGRPKSEGRQADSQ
jgi:hypothetical protein